MDPKSIANLDPKLRETYERVMGTATPSSAGPSAPPASPASLTPVDGFATFTSPASHDPPHVEAGSEEVLSPITQQVASNIPLGAKLSQPNDPTSAQDLLSSVSPTVTPYTPESPGGSNLAAASPLPSPSAIPSQGPSTMIRILYIVGAIVFFVVYTIFWIKVFKLPFLF